MFILKPLTLSYYNDTTSNIVLVTMVVNITITKIHYIPFKYF